jgi:hypothetical protein
LRSARSSGFFLGYPWANRRGVPDQMIREGYAIIESFSPQPI